MLTVIESDLFVKQASEYLTDEQRLDFLAWLAKNPEAGDLIANSDGARKIRVPLNQGKSGGARVIYYRYDAHRLHAVLFYAKSRQSTIKGHDIKRHKK